MPDKIKVSGDFYTTSDGFGYDKYANTIINMITDADFPSPFTFGVFGEWGTGKTSLMRMIEERLRNEYFDVFIPVWFNPWRYEKERHLIIPFLKTIQHSIESHLEENKTANKKLSEIAFKKLKELKNRISKIAFTVISSLEGELNLQIVKIKADLSKAVETAGKMEDKQIEKIEEYSSIYHNIVKYLSNVSEQEPYNLRIAVFIDDLDRCLPEKAIEVLEGIKTFLDIPGYLFFIGVDRNVIEKGVKVKYRGYVIDDKTTGKKTSEKDEHFNVATEIPITPSDYLEKIVQMPIPLPPIDKTRVEGYLKELIQANSSLMPYMDIIQLGLKQNPRTYKRFINTLAFHTKLAVEKGCLKINDSDTGKDTPLMTLELLVKWTILNFAFQSLVEEMKNKKLLIVDLQYWIERQDKEKQGLEDLTRTEKDAGITEAPSPLRHWLQDDKLRNILRKNIERGDTGFSRDNIDLYIQMGEFSFIEARTPPEGIMLPLPKIEGEGKLLEPIGKMMRIPKGEFLYGKDKKKMTLNDYEIGVYPVTNEKYKEFIESKPEYKLPENWINENRTYPEGKKDHPVVYVNFDDAQAYCEWRTEREGVKYRLPTEAEWEKAARGTDGREYSWGDEFDKNKCNTYESGIGDTTPVYKYLDGVSFYGCYDMAGNVWEWTDSWYDKSKRWKVLRGGSWGDGQGVARCASRGGDFPDFRDINVGFRCARPL